MKQCNNRKSRKGFTLIELLVVIALLGILSGGILIALNITGTIGKANITKAKRFAAQLENGLAVNQAGKWSFEDVVSGVTPDTSGYGNVGTLVNNPGWQTADQCMLGFGRCLGFDGTTRYVQATSQFGNVNFKTQPFTFTAWIKLDGTASGWYAIAGIKPTAASAIYGVQFWENTGWGEFLNFYSSDASGGGGTRRGFVALTGGLTLGTWYHIGFVYDGLAALDTDPPSATDATHIKLYVDGVSKNISPDGASFGWTAGDNIITIGGIAAYSFKGLIDEVQIYNQPLTLSQIRELYAQGVVRRAIAYR